MLRRQWKTFCELVRMAELDKAKEGYEASQGLGWGPNYLPWAELSEGVQGEYADGAKAAIEAPSDEAGAKAAYDAYNLSGEPDWYPDDYQFEALEPEEKDGWLIFSRTVRNASNNRTQ
jgi:hypothetical protein